MDYQFTTTKKLCTNVGPTNRNLLWVTCHSQKKMVGSPLARRYNVNEKRPRAVFLLLGTRCTFKHP